MITYIITKIRKLGDWYLESYLLRQRSWGSQFEASSGWIDYEILSQKNPSKKELVEWLKG
jgi:hypothetical protein